MIKTKFLLPFLLLGASLCPAQAPVVLVPAPQFQAWTATGLPLAFGCVFTYQSQTTNPLATYTDFTGLYQNPNPVVLSASGTASIWIQAGQAYTLIVKSAGGTNCALGTTRYTVDGIGGGLTTLTTVVTPSGGSATFTDQSQVQLFTLLLTGNVVGQPLTAVGIIPPGLITFQITQDGVGAHTFSWPANAINPATICPTANCVTTQTFVWNGTNATAIGPASYSIGPASAVANLYDYGLSASATVCTDSAKQLTSTCGSPYTVTYNGQAVGPGGSGNVNAGAATHSMALNEGAGAPLAGLTLGANEVAMGVVGADPVNKAVPTCTSVQPLTFDGTIWTCLTPIPIISTVVKTLGAPVGISTNTTVLTQAVTMPASGCPCRALLNWTANADTTNSGTMAVTINDGTNNFATAATSTPGSASDFSIAGSGISIGTYANNAAITFTMKASTSMAGGPNIHTANAAGLGQNTYMQISILSSN